MRNIHSIIPKGVNQTFYYFTKKAEIKNPLGQVSATLTEYLVSIDEDLTNILTPFIKLPRAFGTIKRMSRINIPTK